MPSARSGESAWETIDNHCSNFIWLECILTWNMKRKVDIDADSRGLLMQTVRYVRQRDNEGIEECGLMSPKYFYLLPPRYWRYEIRWMCASVTASVATERCLCKQPRKRVVLSRKVCGTLLSLSRSWVRSSSHTFARRVEPSCAWCWDSSPKWDDWTSTRLFADFSISCLYEMWPWA